MTEFLFLAFCSLLFLGICVWGFRVLPDEQWQMLAVVPVRKAGDGHWLGTNLTFYGFLVAGATGIATLYSMILLHSASMPLTAVMAVFLLVFAVSLPASKILARLVEKKRHTFTIGGAFFSGLLVAPWAILAVNAVLHAELNVLATLAALSIGYVLGEGLGRLACISFGCCYGKPLSQCHWLTRKLFSRCPLIFTGATKKVAYDGGLEGEKLIPIQALTSLLFTATALIATHFFLQGQYRTALLLSLSVSQLWRFLSETLRADFRGLGTISVYQKMSLIALPYAWIVTMLFPATNLPHPALSLGLHILGQPAPMISIQLLWLIVFYIFGRSTATSATISFQLARDIHRQ